MTTLTAGQVQAFGSALEGALNLREEDGHWTWDCGHDHAASNRILGDLGLSYQQIEEVIAELNDRGGHCDCEVILNVLCGQGTDAKPGRTTVMTRQHQQPAKDDPFMTAWLRWRSACIEFTKFLSTAKHYGGDFDCLDGNGTTWLFTYQPEDEDEDEDEEEGTPAEADVAELLNRNDTTALEEQLNRNDVGTLVKMAMHDREGATPMGQFAAKILEQLAWANGWGRDQTAAAPDWAGVGEMARNPPPQGPSDQ
jgi:hypothetical protein